MSRSVADPRGAEGAIAPSRRVKSCKILWSNNKFFGASAEKITVKKFSTAKSQINPRFERRESREVRSEALAYPFLPSPPPRVVRAEKANLANKGWK
jgi:hypothetical protein